MMTYNQFRDGYFDTILPKKHYFIRKGQALMNYLCEVNPELYRDVVDKSCLNNERIDCFYDDNLIPNTLNYLEKVWPNNQA